MRAAFLVALIAIAAPAQAVVQLDQDAKVAAPPPGGVYAESGLARAGANGYDMTQTFTAGLTGTLARIDLQTYRATSPATTFTLSVFSGNAATGGTLLGSTTLSNTQSFANYQAGGMTAISLSSLGIAVSAGSQYSYQISSSHAAGSPTTLLQSIFGTDSANDPDGSAGVYNDYQGGRNYRRTFVNGATSGWDLLNYPIDRGFQTFVDVAPVPEPGDWAMMVGGLAIVGGIARRRKRTG